jgi:hypothetical protein
LARNRNKPRTEKGRSPPGYLSQLRARGASKRNAKLWRLDSNLAIVIRNDTGWRLRSTFLPGKLAAFLFIVRLPLWAPTSPHSHPLAFLPLIGPFAKSRRQLAIALVGHLRTQFPHKQRWGHTKVRGSVAGRIRHPPSAQPVGDKTAFYSQPVAPISRSEF